MMMMVVVNVHLGLGLKCGLTLRVYFELEV